MTSTQPGAASVPPAKRRRKVQNVELNTTSITDRPSGSLDETAHTDSPGAPQNKSQGSRKRTRKTSPSGRRTTKPPLVRHESSVFVDSTIPWPGHLTRLAQTHKALNLVYTFCCTRKHLATTFDTIKTAVESHTKSELLVEDVAQIKTLVPKAINFAYVDEAMLEVNVTNESSTKASRKAKDDQLFEITNLRDNKKSEVILFEFIDGDLKRQVQHGQTGEPVRAFRKLRHEDLKMPVFSQKQMMNLIEKRNTKFTSAINEFLNHCEADLVDPVQKLKEESAQYIPTPSEDPASAPGPGRQARLPASIPMERSSIPQIIEELKSLSWYSGQIVPDGHRVFDPQPPIYGDLQFALSQNLVNALFNTRGIEQLYSHQAEAINNLHDGHNVIVATSTSSGKSLIYQIPVMHELEQDRNARAMYIFPTKALAQDQRRSLKDLLRLMDGLQDIVVETFDGDTPMAERNKIRDEARIIFTNPDMLHITILPQEQSWRTFLQNLKYVVVDELHVYNGLFGAHVAFIMRRLRRICAAVGNTRIKFISCSATVSNPEEHMKTIFGVEQVKLIDFDGSPSGRKEFLCWNTPFKDPADPTSGRADTMAESAKLFCQLILRGVRVIAFCKIRRQCEILIGAVKTELAALERSEVMARVMGYRGGYAPQDRRRIEKEMFEGKLVGIVATSALELGIDIGSLDAVITVGFPYSIANLRQQSGRAGRRNKDSLSVLVGDCFPTDQHYMANPDEIFTKPNCELKVDLENTLVLEGHMQCAAHEMPIRSRSDGTYFGQQLRTIAQERMRLDDEGFYHCNERFLPHPSKFVNIRDTEDEHFAIIDTTNGRNVVLEELEASRAFFTIYDGGIFLHQGQTYLVRDFSQEGMRAHVERVNVDWYTQQRDYTDIDPVETEAIRSIPGSASRAFFGPIRITQVVFGFFKLDKKRRILDAVEVDNPPIVLRSKGLWLDVPKLAIDILTGRDLNVAAAIHAAEHAVLGLLPSFVVSIPGDVRTECKNAKKELAKRDTARKRPARLNFYDAKGGPGGSGIATKAFEFIDVLLRRACERISVCPCPDGCLECCCDENCRQANQIISKAGAEVILRSLLNWEIDIDALPWGNEDRVPAGIETVVLAEEVPAARGRRIEVMHVKREDDVPQTQESSASDDPPGTDEVAITVKAEPE